VEALLHFETGARAGEDIDLEGDEVAIGRSRQSALVLPDPKVSRAHALLRHHPDAWVVEDLGSKNGTWVNGRRISGPTRLQHGDMVQVGDHRAAFVSPGDVPDEPTLAGEEGGLGPDDFTDRELATLRGIAAGMSNRQIADELVVSLRTVKAYVTALLRR
jgi:pSer/pThr/pTyr-binding forkhead associated (FHA) protein